MTRSATERKTYGPLGALAASRSSGPTFLAEPAGRNGTLRYRDRQTGRTGMAPSGPPGGASALSARSTIERMALPLQEKRNDRNPVGRNCVANRANDAGHQASMTEALRRKLQSQYAAHPSWSAPAA